MHRPRGLGTKTRLDDSASQPPVAAAAGGSHSGGGSSSGDGGGGSSSGGGGGSCGTAGGSLSVVGGDLSNQRQRDTHTASQWGSTAREPSQPAHRSQSPPAAPTLLSSSPVHVTGLPPLYFQHAGHSRTIVGIERRRASGRGPDTYTILVFDPSENTSHLESVLR
ncbi:MAG: hypothetical protein WDW36_008944 [Sanguina aurantia]